MRYLLMGKPKRKVILIGKNWNGWRRYKEPDRTIRGALASKGLAKAKAQ